MTVIVTLADGGTDKYMRFGDEYIRHNDGTLDVLRRDAKHPLRYASKDWRDVEGDEKRFRGRFLGG